MLVRTLSTLTLVALAAACSDSAAPAAIDAAPDAGADAAPPDASPPDGATPDGDAADGAGADEGPADAAAGDVGPDGPSLPAGFQRTAINQPSGLLCDVPADYVANGGDPVNPVCELEVDHLSDRPLTAPVPTEIKVVTWNVEFGKDSAGVRAALKNTNALADADVVLLQECPRGDKASDPDGINLAREIAVARKYDYIFAVEWDRRDDDKGGGEHGMAILSKFPIGNAKLIRHTPAHDTYAEKGHFGGRATLAVDLAIGPTRLRLYNSHLATRDVDGNERALQGQEIRQDADKSYQPKTQIVGGDFNTFTCNPALLKCNEPPAAEEVVEDFLDDGWLDLTPGFNSWTQLGIGVFPQRLDWLFGRQVTPVSHVVLKDVRPADHVPVVATVSLP